MSISISVDLTFDIESRDGLIAFIIAHLELDTETAAQVPNFIRMAEYRFNRLIRAPESDTAISYTTTGGSATQFIPVDYRQVKGVRLVGDAGYALQHTSWDALHDEYSNKSGRPTVWTLTAGNFRLGPVPDSEYEIRIDYLAKIPALTEAAPVNWLLSSHADAYIYGALWQAAAWLEDIDAATAFYNEMMTIIEEINMSGNLFRNATPTRLRSPVVV